MSITPDEISRSKRFEGNVNHFYLDSTGNVTVGCGHMIPNINSATAMPLIRNTDGLPATIVEKQTEWTTIKSKPLGQNNSAGYYAQFCNLKLNQSDIDNILINDLSVVENQLSTYFTNYAQFPQQAKAGLVDMVFNIGMNGLETKFPNFINAVKKQDWATAASECNRTGIPANRNTEVNQLFLQAVKPAPSPSPTPGSGITGPPITLTTSDVPDWLNQFSGVPNVQAPSYQSPPLVSSALPGYVNGSSTESQSIVAIVALSANVATTAITAITAIAVNSKKNS